MDTVGDFITTLRNASAAKKAYCSSRYSNLRERIAETLLACGYVKEVEKEVRDENGKSKIKVFLKYVNGTPAITEIGRMSRPGCRRYTSLDEIPNILGGMGECILSTSKGVMSGKAAKSAGVGGELLCYVW